MFKGLILNLVFVATLMLTQPSFATPTENNSIRVLPAPGKVVVNGSARDWDLSGGIFICDNVQTQRDSYGVWMFSMYDRDNVYLLAHFIDSTPLNNPGQTLADFGWSGDCLQVRFLTGKYASVINAWKGVDGKDVVQLDSPMTHHSPWGQDVKPDGAQQAFQVDADGKGYVQEIALPWKFITSDGQPLASGATFNMTFEPNFTVGLGGRMSIKDNFKAGMQIDRVFTFMNHAEWGPATLATSGHVAPQPLRLADGREFKVSLANGVPVVDWTGLIKSIETPGFIPITFVMPQDGSISLNIKNSQGQVVRQLLNDAFFTKGPHTVKWDGLPTPNLHLSGPPLPQGTYTWSALYNGGIGLKFRGWADNGGQAPWDNGPATNWGGDEGNPIAVASDSKGVYLGWTGAEAAKALIATDFQGKMRWGNKHGGIAGIRALAADGNAVYVLDSSLGSIFKLSSADGSYLPWGSSTDSDLAVKSIWGDPNATLDKVNAIAACDGKLYLAFAAANKIAVVDASTGKLLNIISVTAPQDLWTRKAGEVYVLSGGVSVLRLMTGDGTSTSVISGLSNTSGMSGDVDGNIYVGTASTSTGTPDQVREYDGSGKLVRTLGRSGGRVTQGAWDPNSFLNISSVSLAPDGKLWVAENADYPKRFSAWNTTSGTAESEFFGSTLYGGLGGSIDPKDPDIMVGAGCEWRIDPHTGRAKCVTLITPSGMQATRIAMASNGRVYLFVSPGWYVFGKTPYITVYERLDSGEYKKRAQFTFDASTTKYWADANGDQQEQPDEVQNVDGVLQFNNWYMAVAPDLSIYIKRSQFKVTGFTAAGAPVYDFAHPTVLPATDPSMADSQRTDEGLGSADGRLVLYNGNYLAGRTTFRAFDIASGKMLWSYPNNYVGVHGSHNATGPEVGFIRGAYGVLGVAKLPPPIGNLWAIGTNVGEWHLLTEDGFYLSRLFEPDSLKVKFPEQPVPGADMTEAPPGLGGEDFGGSMTLGQDGKLYVQAGKTAFWNLEVTGLDTVRAVKGGQIAITAADVPKAQAIREAQLQVTQSKKTTVVRMMTPVFTGNLKADFKGSELVTYEKGDDSTISSSAAWDDQCLYLGWDVADSRPWTNSAKDPAEMYTSGDTVDFQLGTDPSADKNRAEAVLGDLRLSIGNFGGQPTAVIYRRAASLKKPRTFNSGVFKNYVMQYVGVVATAKIAVNSHATGYTVEAAIPLGDLALKPVDALPLHGDFGVTYGDPAGQRTRQRIYWSNQHTGIVDDAVAELMMEPQYWGDLTFEK